MNYQDPRVRELARLQVRLGAAVEKGQRLHIKNLPVECAEYASILVEEAYLAGAANVTVTWHDAELERLHCKYAHDEALGENFGPDREAWQAMVDRGDCQIVFFGPSPNMYKDCDAERVQKIRTASREVTMPYTIAHCEARVCQCTSAIPTKDWAAEVFPELSPEAAVDALWEAMLKVCRINGDGKALERWQKFIDDSRKYCEILNRAELTELRYKNSLGTDLVIGLPKGHIWEDASAKTADGKLFFQNFPTEEIYTTPHRLRAEGTIAASMPLYWMGSVIRDIRLTMKEGKVIEYSASQGEDFLKQLLETDEGAVRLGECALVSWDSPIRASGTEFCNMLFDENAACHFALGLGFEGSVLPGGEADGVNNSSVHMDFMIGTADLSVTGIRADGSELPILRDGCYVL